MRRLTAKETRATLRGHGLDKSNTVAFAFRDPARQTFYDWHTHRSHQLIFALEGATQIETADARFLLPLDRAAWIPAGVRHRTLITDIDGTSIYFPPRSVPRPGDRVRILAADGLMREMMTYAMRWQDKARQDPLRKSFFQTLSLLCAQWLESELPLSLPGATHPGLVRAMDHALSGLDTASQSAALKQAGLSERSFRRLFLAQTRMTWQAWLTQARVLTAMTLLAGGRRVTDAAADVGYQSLSAFAKAFVRLTGENPAHYRRRVVGTSGAAKEQEIGRKKAVGAP